MDQSLHRNLAGDEGTSAAVPSLEKSLALAQSGSSDVVPSRDSGLAHELLGSKDGVPAVLASGEASPSSGVIHTIQSPAPDSDSSEPLLSSKLVARIKSIDGPVIHHTATLGINSSLPLGETGKISRSVNAGSQLLGRRSGSGKGSFASSSK